MRGGIPGLYYSPHTCPGSYVWPEIFILSHFCVPVGSRKTPLLNFPVSRPSSAIFLNTHQYKLICYCTVARRRRKIFGFSHPFCVFPLLFLISWWFTGFYLRPLPTFCEWFNFLVDPASPASSPKTIAREVILSAWDPPHTCPRSYSHVLPYMNMVLLKP